MGKEARINAGKKAEFMANAHLDTAQYLFDAIVAQIAVDNPDFCGELGYSPFLSSAGKPWIMDVFIRELCNAGYVKGIIFTAYERIETSGVLRHVQVLSMAASDDESFNAALAATYTLTERGGSGFYALLGNVTPKVNRDGMPHAAFVQSEKLK